MLHVKITGIGNSTGVILPREALARLKVDKGDSLYLIETPDGGYRVSAHDPVFAEQMAVARQIMHDRRAVLAELAK
jgi:putative addiction module antidote